MLLTHTSECVTYLFHFSEKYSIGAPEQYAFLKQSGCLTIDSINDVKDFGETLVCLVFAYALRTRLSTASTNCGVIIFVNETYAACTSRVEIHGPGN